MEEDINLPISILSDDIRPGDLVELVVLALVAGVNRGGTLLLLLLHQALEPFDHVEAEENGQEADQVVEQVPEECRLSRSQRAHLAALFAEGQVHSACLLQNMERQLHLHPRRTWSFAPEHDQDLLSPTPCLLGQLARFPIDSEHLAFKKGSQKILQYSLSTLVIGSSRTIWFTNDYPYWSLVNRT